MDLKDCLKKTMDFKDKHRIYNIWYLIYIYIKEYKKSHIYINLWKYIRN